MFKSLEEARAAWDEESSRMAEGLDALPAAALKARIAEGHRDVPRIVWHLAQTCADLAGTVKGVPAPDLAAEPPVTAAALAAGFREGASAVSAALAAVKDLGDAVAFYGSMQPFSAALRWTMLHQAHHGGQLSALLRQAGFQPPVLQGQRLEDWAGLGMEVPAV